MLQDPSSSWGISYVPLPFLDLNCQSEDSPFKLLPEQLVLLLTYFVLVDLEWGSPMDKLLALSNYFVGFFVSMSETMLELMRWVLRLLLNESVLKQFDFFIFFYWYEWKMIPCRFQAMSLISATRWLCLQLRPKAVLINWANPDIARKGVESRNWFVSGKWELNLLLATDSKNKTCVPI